MQRAAGDNPENMSRAQIRQLIATGQLSPGELRTYRTSYQEKLARPFAAFVFTLIAVPFGLRSPRAAAAARASASGSPSRSSSCTSSSRASARRSLPVSAAVRCSPRSGRGCRTCSSPRSECSCCGGRRRRSGDDRRPAPRHRDRRHRGRDRVRRRPRRPSGRPASGLTLFGLAPKVHVDGRRGRNRHGHRARRHDRRAGRVELRARRVLPPDRDQRPGQRTPGAGRRTRQARPSRQRRRQSRATCSTVRICCSQPSDSRQRGSSSSARSSTPSSQNVNRNYVPRGLKRYAHHASDPQIQQELREYLDRRAIAALLAQGPVLVIAAPTKTCSTTTRSTSSSCRIPDQLSSRRTPSSRASRSTAGRAINPQIAFPRSCSRPRTTRAIGKRHAAPIAQRSQIAYTGSKHSLRRRDPPCGAGRFHISHARRSTSIRTRAACRSIRPRPHAVSGGPVLGIDPGTRSAARRRRRAARAAARARSRPVRCVSRARRSARRAARRPRRSRSAAAPTPQRPLRRSAASTYLSVSSTSTRRRCSRARYFRASPGGAGAGSSRAACSCPRAPSTTSPPS